MEIVVLTVLLGIIVSFLTGKSDENKITEPKKECSSKDEPHKWSYNKDNRLQCIECNLVAGIGEE